MKKTNQQWSIALNTKPSTELSIDYSGFHWQTHRLRQSYHKSPLRKALGRATAGPILDACAGLGRDCIILSALGYKVTACETNPVVFFLLQQAIHRSKFSHIELIQDNSLNLLEQRNNWPIIYLDPMFSSIGKAQVKKPARVLRALVANYDADNELLFHKARHNCSRLVVKRHIDAPALAGITADIQYSGQSTRYDVYLQPDADNS